jgi:hypothetical protein
LGDKWRGFGFWWREIEGAKLIRVAEEVRGVNGRLWKDKWDASGEGCVAERSLQGLRGLRGGNLRDERYLQ